MSKWLIISGIVLIVAGLILHFAPGAFNWLGRLPGDIRIESGRTKIYIPITTMLIISLILTLVIRLLKH